MAGILNAFEHQSLRMKFSVSKPTSELPFGPNIHFAYQISSGQIRFIHHSLSWISDGAHEAVDISHIKSQVQQDQIPLILSAFEKFLQGTFTGSVSICLETRVGEKWIEITPFLAQINDEELLLATVEDVTATAQNDGVLIKYANQKNSILHMLAHDLRGPLGAARAVVQTIREENNHGLEIKTDHIASIIAQSINLIDDLIQRELLEATEVSLVKKNLNIVKIVNDYMDECRRSNELSDRIFEFHSTSEEILIELDNSKFMQVINNLISNALKFTKSRGHISVSISETESTVNLSVKDDGIGIPQHLIPVLFDKFTPAARMGLDGEPTIGLGMSITKMIIEWHQGTISCQSTEGIGTVISIILPKVSKS